MKEKVERLYSEYQQAVAEMDEALAAFNEVRIALSRTMAQASLARDAYNQALAEYAHHLRRQTHGTTGDKN